MPEVIPVFMELLARHDLTRRDVLLYGMIVAANDNAEPVRMSELEKALGVERNNMQKALKHLLRAGLIRRDRRAWPSDGRRTKYVPIGPMERKVSDG